MMPTVGHPESQTMKWWKVWHSLADTVHPHHIPTDPNLVCSLCASVLVRTIIFRKINFVCKILKTFLFPYKSHVMNPMQEGVSEACRASGRAGSGLVAKVGRTACLVLPVVIGRPGPSLGTQDCTPASPRPWRLALKDAICAPNVIGAKKINAPQIPP